jgi:hypothetical protein
LARDRQRLELARAHLLHRIGQVVEHQLDLPAEQVLHRGRAALVGHVHHVDLGLGFEQLAGKMAGAPVAARAERELARIRLRITDQLGDRIGRHRRIQHQHVRRNRDQGDRREVLDRVVRHLAVQADVDRVRRQCALEDRVAVGRAFRDQVGADVAAGARSVVDDHRLSPGDRELLSDRAGDRVGDPPAGKGTTRRIGLDG